MAKTRTQRYINKFCELSNILLNYWQSGETPKYHERVYNRFVYIGLKLGIITDDPNFGLGSVFPNISNQFFNLDDYQHDPDYCKKTKEQMNLRIQLAKEYKQAARAIKKPIPDIEAGPKSEIDHSNLEKDIETFCDCIECVKDSILAIPNNNGYYEKPQIDRPKGEKANRLAVKLGLISKNRKFSYEIWGDSDLQKAKKIPFAPAEPGFHLENSSDKKWLKILDNWQIRAKKITIPKNEKPLSFYLESQEYVGLTQASINYSFAKSTLTKYSKKKPGEVNYMWSIKVKGRKFFRRKDMVTLAESHNKIAFNRDIN